MKLPWKFVAPCLIIFTSVFTLSNLESNEDIELLCSYFLQMETFPGRRKIAHNIEKSPKSYESEEAQKTYKTQKCLSIAQWPWANSCSRRGVSVVDLPIRWTELSKDEASFIRKLQGWSSSIWLTFMTHPYWVGSSQYVMLLSKNYQIPVINLSCMLL